MYNEKWVKPNAHNSIKLKIWTKVNGYIHFISIRITKRKYNTDDIMILSVLKTLLSNRFLTMELEGNSALNLVEIQIHKYSFSGMLCMRKILEDTSIQLRIIIFI